MIMLLAILKKTAYRVETFISLPIVVCITIQLHVHIDVRVVKFKGTKLEYIMFIAQSIGLEVCNILLLL